MAAVTRRGTPDHLLKWLEAVQIAVVRDVEPLLDDAARAAGMRRLRILQMIPSDGIRQIDLATRAMVTKQALGPVIEGMEADGLIHRQPDPRDARAWLVMLTPQGQDAAASLDRAVAAIEARLELDVGASDAASFWRVLRRVGEPGSVEGSSERPSGDSQAS
jgi:DNA-binding MarR family transcriptional regulator